MSYAITINRTSKLEKPLGGIGEGRETEGLIQRNWTASEMAITAASLGLRAISNVQLTPGSTVDVVAHGRVVSPGSWGNTARIRTYLIQTGKVRVGTPRYTTFSPAFSATPDIVLTSGSPATRTIGTYEPRLRTQRPGSFSHVGSPTFADCGYMAVGAGSYPINFIAKGF